MRWRITDIANAEKLPGTYNGSVIPFALLTPDITEAFLEGAQPIDPILDRLTNLSLPIGWAEERSVLAFKESRSRFCVFVGSQAEEFGPNSQQTTDACPA